MDEATRKKKNGFPYDSKWISRLSWAVYCHSVKEMEACDFSWPSTSIFSPAFFSLSGHEAAGKKAGSKICNCLNILSACSLSRVQLSCNLLVIKKTNRFFVLFCITWNPHAMPIIIVSWYCGNIIWFITCTDLILFSHVWNSTSTCNLFFNVCNASINDFFLIPLITWGI